jgi:hypothetical protein
MRTQAEDLRQIIGSVSDLGERARPVVAGHSGRAFRSLSELR